ncbi:MAG: metal-dependent hydrolase [Campylobacterales bacterium]|nr:metal-dependent hydrolase [Campylobacterales bacterium]
MKILKANYIYIDGEYFENYAVVFDTKIIDVGSVEEIAKNYPDATIEELGEGSVLFPGFINTHVHLEFSSNQTTLKYGSFVRWLESVFASREEIMNASTNRVIKAAMNDMLSSGVTAFGAISSYGMELDEVAKSKQKALFFNELIGSNPQSIDILYNDFLERIAQSSKYPNITPAIAIHSPYSVHPIAIRKALEFAKSKKLKVSTHFMESRAEKEWLEGSHGEFKPFFEKYLGVSHSMSTKEEFLTLFNALPTHLTHATQVDESDLDTIAKYHHTIAHCPRSNRFLGSNPMPLSQIIAKGIKFSVATDGLSSNYSLNILDELRAALMVHEGIELNYLADKLIESITKSANAILGLNGGVIAKGRDADFAVLYLSSSLNDLASLSLWSILHNNQASRVYINGEAVFTKV